MEWGCHICKEIRPDEKISVISKPIVMNHQEIGQQNIRYCNDKASCTEEAKDFKFFV